MINQPSDLLTELANDFESVNVIDLIKLKLKEKGLSETKKHKIQSSKNPNVQYNVTEDNGNWECDCPSYTYTGGNECKHIRELKTK